MRCISILVFLKLCCIVVLNRRMYDKKFNMFIAYQNGASEEARNQVLRGTLRVQKCFRSYKARRYFHELKRGAISLQSCKEHTLIFGLYNGLVIFWNRYTLGGSVISHNI